MYLIAVLLGAAFLHPLFERAGRSLAKSVVLLVLVFTAVLPVSWLADLAGRGMVPVVFQTAGFQAPVSISLRVGIEEAVFLIMINAAALFGGIYLMLRKSPKWEGKVQVLFLTMLLGVNGLVLTRDLFNVFIGGKSPGTYQTFPSSANDVSILAHSGIDDLIVDFSAIWAFHRPSSWLPVLICITSIQTSVNISSDIWSA